MDFPKGSSAMRRAKKFLAEQGIETLRFWNRAWRQKREGCLLEIWNAVQKRSGWVRVMTNPEAQKFVPPDLKTIKALGEKRTNPSP